MLKPLIIPAIIAKSQQELDERVNKVKEAAEWMQLDIMDNKFVPNSSLYFDFKLPQGCKFEAHLMVENPLEWIEKHWGKVDTIIVHIESCKEPEKIVDFVQSKKKKLGFAINPETAVKELEPYFGEVDEVLVMTVHPGFYGSKFLPETLEKVKALRELKPGLDIEVDGGINLETIKEAYAAGANLFVSGSCIMKSDNPENAINTLKKCLKD